MLDKEDIKIYIEENDDTLKKMFTVNIPLFDGQAGFKNSEDAKYSALAEKIFSFQAIDNVFIEGNEITINSSSTKNWDRLKDDLIDIIFDILSKGKDIVSKDYIPLSIAEKIKNNIAKDDIVLYMKGSGDFPQCGFSAKVVNILKSLNVKFETYNVLEDENVRNEIKNFTDWPTIPQLFIKGEFIGGSDIVEELFESGELKDLVSF